MASVMNTYLSHSGAHYLMAIRDLLSERGYARGVDVAERIGVSRTAAYQALQTLKGRGLVKEDERHFYSLPDDADVLAARLSDNQAMLERFFNEVIGLEEEEAKRNACDIEHHLSEAASRGFVAFLRFLETHPACQNLLIQFQEEMGAKPPERRA